MGYSGLSSLLIADGIISPSDAETIAKDSSGRGASFAKVIVASGILDEAGLANYLHKKTGKELIPPGKMIESTPQAACIFDRHIMRHLEIVPMSFEGAYLKIAMPDPLDTGIIQQLEFFSGAKINPIIATLSSVYKTIATLIPDFAPSETPLEHFVKMRKGTPAPAKESRPEPTRPAIVREIRQEEPPREKAGNGAAHPDVGSAKASSESSSDFGDFEDHHDLDDMNAFEQSAAALEDPFANKEEPEEAAAPAPREETPPDSVAQPGTSLMFDDAAEGDGTSLDDLKSESNENEISDELLADTRADESPDEEDPFSSEGESATPAKAADNTALDESLAMIDETADDEMLAMSSDEDILPMIEDSEALAENTTNEDGADLQGTLEEPLSKNERSFGANEDDDLFGESEEAQKASAEPEENPFDEAAFDFGEDPSPLEDESESSAHAEIESSDELEDSLLNLDDAPRQPAPAISKDDSQKRQKALATFHFALAQLSLAFDEKRIRQNFEEALKKAEFGGAGFMAEARPLVYWAGKVPNYSQKALPANYDLRTWDIEEMEFFALWPAGLMDHVILEESLKRIGAQLYKKQNSWANFPTKAAKKEAFAPHSA